MSLNPRLRREQLPPLALMGLALAVSCSYSGCGGTGEPEEPAESLVWADSLPDFASIVDVTEMKTRFFDFMRPMVLSENDRVMQKRERLLTLHRQARSGKPIRAADDRWLAELVVQYDVQGFSSSADTLWAELISRVDVIPLELALAQAVIESGWGRAYLARRGNGVFGEWCFVEGCGVEPRNRPPGAGHEVAKFDSVNLSVRSYIHNLNTNGAYRKLRRIRRREREAGYELDAIALAAGLGRYSERGEGYIREVRTIIRTNRHLMLGQPKPLP